MVAAGNATAQPLMWGSQNAADALGPPFDLVIASDVVYREDVFKPLIETLEMVVCRQHTTIHRYEVVPTCARKTCIRIFA